MGYFTLKNMEKNNSNNKLFWLLTNVFLGIGLLFIQTNFSQAHTVRVFGTITDEEDTGLPQASINFISQDKADTTSTQTDNTGYYSLRLVLKDNGVNDNKPPTSNKYNLFQNYPNPFNPGTHISFQLHEPAKVKITVYDLLGRQIKELTNTQYPDGKSEVYWDGTNDRNNLV
jgi:hypothetical protein